MFSSISPLVPMFSSISPLVPMSSSISLLVLCLRISLSSQTPCRCYNPYEDSLQDFLGDPSRNCDSTGVCFVPCDSDCPDRQPAPAHLFTGRGRCVAGSACRLDGGFVPDRPDIVVVGGLDQNCKEGSKCEQENIFNYVKENIQNCEGSDCLQEV
eukprot:GFUD01135407.1.p1 GENE.GFUD01135407.1~~GFUD01135407.1.p1  ORF type:complete len:155 (-),score=36.04 GFUD01135407.1:78-542(-)